MLLYDMYENEAGIFNHRTREKDRPLSSIALHEPEDNTSTSRLYAMIEAYRGKGIKDLFGLNLIEFLNLPTEYCTFLMEVATREGNRNNKILNELNSIGK